MRRRLRARLAASDGEAGLTLVELLVASAMGVALLGAIGAMVLSSLGGQPRVTERVQNVSTARYVLERLTREIRNGIAVEPSRATASEVSFRTLVRRTTCGGSVVPSASTPAIQCQVTYSCTTTTCTRVEAAPGVFTGTSTTVLDGLAGGNVFSYLPTAEEPTFIGVTLRLPNPEGGGNLTISDGASLRNATLQN